MANSKPIKLSSIKFGEAEEKAVVDVLRSGQLAQGPKVAFLEQLFRKMSGKRHAVAVANGTLALVGALKAAGIGEGDEVITSPFTFVATLNAILETGASVRFGDISLDNFCLDPQSAKEQVTSKTKALMPVHLYGNTSNMVAFDFIADKYWLSIIEDAAQSHNSGISSCLYDSQQCYSLYATKNITAGEGGVVTTDDDDLARNLRLLRNHGMKEKYSYEIIGHNWRMPEICAAIAIVQMREIDSITEQRQRNAALLSLGLVDIEGITLPTEKSVFHQYTLRITPDAKLSRSEIMSKLALEGIETGVYYPRVVSDYECYEPLKTGKAPRIIEGSIPNARIAASEVLSLPVHNHLSKVDLEKIIFSMRKILLK